jgi:hypothetical protein
MNNIKVNINDYTLVQTSIINNIQINILKIELFKSMTLSVNLLSNNKLIDSKLMTITGDEYTNWGNDDNYIINLIMTKLNLTRKT